MSETIWKDLRQGYLESLQYLDGRRNGTITSLKTPWTNLNNATTDGLEWNSMTVIAGRPGSFKTGMQDQIINQAFDLNPAENFRILKFNFEMMQRTSCIREYSSVIGKSYKYLCSADGKLTKADLDTCHQHAKIASKRPIDVIDQALTVKEFGKSVDDYMEAHSYILGGEKVYTKTLMTYDHSILTRKGDDEKSGLETLYNLGSTITEKKRKYPIAFVILSQLGRGVDSPERTINGRYGNYILESDIFGGDALLQHADSVVALNRPLKHNISIYGQEKFIINDERLIVMHILKSRNGGVGLGFFRAEFEKMQLIETNEPLKAK